MLQKLCSLPELMFYYTNEDLTQLYTPAHCVPLSRMLVNTKQHFLMTTVMKVPRVKNKAL